MVMFQPKTKLMKAQKLNLLFLMFLAPGIVLFNGCSEDEAQPGQLLTNNDVEAGSGRPNNWWNHTGEDKYNVDWADQESFSGSRSLAISTQTADSADFAFWAQTISTNLPRGRDVTLNVKIKSNLIGEGVSIAIRGDDAVQPTGRAEQFATTQDTSPISGSFDWAEYSVRLANVDASTQSLTVYLIYLESTTGEVYFDDISLTY